MRRKGPVGEAGSQSKYPATSTSSTQPLTASPAPCPPDDSKHLRRHPTPFPLETKVGPVLPTNSSPHHLKPGPKHLQVFWVQG